jgi:hypothetical protein
VARYTDNNADGAVDQLNLQLRADVKLTSLQEGTPSYAGRLGATYSRVINSMRYVETTVIHSTLRGDDGSTLSIGSVAHVTSDENGNFVVQFERPRC